MAMAGQPLPKTNPAETVEEGGGYTEEQYGAADVRALLGESAGKTLLVSDEGACSLFSEAAASPRTLSLVFDGDCLPLFSMPDGVSRVAAAGGSGCLAAARYFAELRGIGCLLFPTDATLAGAIGSRQEVVLAGERLCAPLKQGEIYCDPALLAPSLADAYARILLARLAKIETSALFCFGMGEGKFDLFEGYSEEEIVRANARQRRAEDCGTPVGEGVLLAERLRAEGERHPAWRAFVQLLALYAAFFGKGKPRRYFTPDYRARAERAGVEYSPAAVPSAEEYVMRAMAFERMRGRFERETEELIRERERHRAALSRLAGEEFPLGGGSAEALRALPEYGGGLTAVIRDFGLMEWEF